MIKKKSSTEQWQFAVKHWVLCPCCGKMIEVRK